MKLRMKAARKRREVFSVDPVAKYRVTPEQMREALEHRILFLDPKTPIRMKRGTRVVFKYTF